ncbi:MAG: cation:proton antiporter, partial [Pontiella sp.]|nr:cation:proton antiporter [Pontiella sp.]
MHSFELGVLGVLGICIAGGVVGAWIFQKLNIPQVVGYIVVGVLIGDTAFGLLHPSDIVALRPFNNFALGLIGFLVGGELSGSIFKKYGKQFTLILLGEGLAAFLLVGIASTLIVYLVCHSWVTAIAAGIVFGAIASATDPASTIDVLWEYRSAGVLTTAIVAIVALDDALAMTLYGLGTSIATILTQEGGDASIGLTMLHTGKELIGAIMLGVVCGFVLDAMMQYLPQTEKRLGMSIGVLLVCIGLSVAFEMDVILATMAVGIVLVNRAPNRSKKLFETVRSFSTPIYIIFFVLVGARLSLGNMPVWIWALVATYVVMRSLGKWVGAFWGGRLSKAENPVQNYIG